MADTAKAPEGGKADLAPVVLDLGRQKRNLVKKLRSGEGKLLGDINSTINELRTAGTIPAHVQPVIVVVREKRSRGLIPMLKM